MFNPLMFLHHKFVLDLLLGAKLFLHDFTLLFLLSFLLLCADHLLKGIILEGLLVAHHMHEILLLLLFLFNRICLTFNLFLHLTTLNFKCILLLFFDFKVDLFA